MARIDVHGKSITLGEHGSRASWRLYNHLKAAFDAGVENPGLTLADLCGMFMREFVNRRCARSPERDVYAAALNHLHSRYGEMPATAFSPEMYEDLRRSLARSGLSATTINHYMRRILSMLRWAARYRHVPPTVPYLLETVPPMAPDEARQTSQVSGVSDEDLGACVAFLPPRIADMVMVQRRTGMRPGEVRQMRRDEVDRSEAVWVYSPKQHKTAHKNKRRVIGIPASATDLLKPYFETHTASPYVFLSEIGLPYTRERYRQLIDEACRKAGVARFSPNQLRHAFADEADAALGRLSASKLLGHSKPDTTALYVSRDLTETVMLTERLDSLRQAGA